MNRSDLAAAKPWNKGKAVGQKRPFTPGDVRAIAGALFHRHRVRDHALFCLGIDSMLRGIDLTRLTWSQVMDANGKVRSELHIKQHKTGEAVSCALSTTTQNALLCLFEKTKAEPRHFVFACHGSNGLRPLSTCVLRRRVKAWAQMIGLDPGAYSSHSLRRTKPAILYAQNVKPETLRILLGHKSLQSTQSYLGIDKQDALAAARALDLFSHEERPPHVD